jgi:hypothetical protein
VGRNRVGQGAGLTLAFLQGQQRPRGICSDPPLEQLSRRPGPPPHDAGQPAGRGPPPPPPPCPPALAAPHPQPLLVDGGTFLRSVIQGQVGAALGLTVVFFGGPCQLDHCASAPQALGTLPYTRTCPLASLPLCPAPWPQCSPCPRTPPHSWSSYPRSPHPTPPHTHWVRAPSASLLTHRAFGRGSEESSSSLWEVGEVRWVPGQGSGG